MQYSPKLKNAMERIKAILKEEDIGGYVVLHTPGFSEYLHEISPTYSCAKFDYSDPSRIGILFKAKAADLPGGAEERNQKISDTDNLLYHLVTNTGKTFMMLDAAYQNFEKATGGFDHTKGGHSSHNEQSN